MQKSTLSRAGLLVFEGSKERRQPVVVVLAPFLVGMVMALGALQAHAEEDLPHVLHALLLPSHVSEPGHGRVIPDGSGSGQDVPNKFIVGLVGLEGLADPFVESVGFRAMFVVPALVSQDGSPLSRKVVGIVTALKECVDDPGAFIRRLVLNEGPGLLQGGKASGNIDRYPSQEGSIVTAVGRGKAEGLQFGKDVFVNQIAW